MGAKKKPLRPEQVLQQACFRWAFMVKPPFQHPDTWPTAVAHGRLSQFLFHIPNGGGRSKAEAGIFSSMGVQPGVPDLFLCLPCQWPGPDGGLNYRAVGGLYIEMKADDGSLSDDQVRWVDRLEMVGYETAICRRLEEFVQVVGVYLGRAVPLNFDLKALQ